MTQWQFAPYTEADLQQQVDNAETCLRPRGAPQVDRATCDELRRRDQRLHRRGAAPTRPRCRPSTRRSARCPQPWTLTDMVAEASLIGGIFGKGGGREVRLGADHCRRSSSSASASSAGRRAWPDFRSQERPGGADDRQGSASRTRPDHAVRQARASRSPTRARVKFETPVAPPARACDGRRAAGARGLRRIGAQLRAALERPGHTPPTGSSSRRARVEERAARSAVHRPAGRLLPAADPDGAWTCTGRGSTPAGPTFPGVGPVRAARPRARLRVVGDHGDDRQRRHLRRGPLPGRLPLPLQGPSACAMEKLERDATPGRRTGCDRHGAGSETLTAYRTVHGIVFARGTVEGARTSPTSSPARPTSTRRTPRSASSAA